MPRKFFELPSMSTVMMCVSPGTLKGDMSSAELNGQWLGRFDGTDPGHIVANIDALESSYEGVAFLINDNPCLPATNAGFTVPGKNHNFEIRTNFLLAHDPKTMAPVPLNELQQRFGKFSQYADVKGTLDGDTFKLSWKTEIGVEGSCSLPRSRAGHRPLSRRKK